MADVLSYDNLLKEFKKMAKRADQRLVRIEQAGKTNVGAYRGAMRRISQFSPGGTRFNIKPPKDVRQLRSRINAVKEFLSTQTSTAKGRKALASQVRAKIKDKYGLDLKSDEEVEALFEGELWSQLNQRFGGSDTVIMILATVQQSDENVKEAILNAREKFFVSDQEAEDAEAIIGQFIQDSNIGKIFGR